MGQTWYLQVNKLADEHPSHPDVELVSKNYSLCYCLGLLWVKSKHRVTNALIQFVPNTVSGFSGNKTYRQPTSYPAAENTTKTVKGGVQKGSCLANLLGK